ncbi:MAG: nuclear transport factor 2 family protein [Flavobacteriaceae bacterium]|nr:nuclear transport factor 2 family protein [Flavobacteriaceae bacterium]NNL80381.1 nuclear transport factor 2 family protein [Flavobacteriaceae bacterium]
MKLKLFILPIVAIFIVSCSSKSTQEDIELIKTVMSAQQNAWNNYDLEGFMKGYWKNDSLKFYGKNGVTYGWENTLENYKKRYPGKDHTGTLKFTLDEISPVDGDSYYIMGQYHLIREVGEANGVFLIIFRKINGEWKIIADLSC